MHRPDFVIELGTMRGGVTLAINEWFPRLPIFTFDKSQERAERYGSGAAPVCNENVEFISANLLGGSHKRLKGLLKLKAKKLMYCDNGDKLYEVQTFAPYLKSGDVIGVHDWLARPRPEDRSERYQEKLIRTNGSLVDTCIVDDREILDYLSAFGFKKYYWEWMEQYPPIPFNDDNEIMITDPRGSCRFWIKK